ncbi:hypothetical protein KCP76_02785 [Salmonella enterica subsp. enterica serovar Weltevreden]|nr:hypothetical protein KCP76_02785 [Salmonella enterica subsp. enterica serovar Weltevreden]
MALSVTIGIADDFSLPQVKHLFADAGGIGPATVFNGIERVGDHVPAFAELTHLVGRVLKSRWGP